MPSRAQIRNVGVDVLNKMDVTAQPDNGNAETSRPAETSAKASVANNKRKKSQGPKQAKPKSSDNVQLFAFDAAQGENSTGGRPKRKLKFIARFESMSFDSKAHCKIGQGFSCPRCSTVCSYDSHQCHVCDLECCYEAGIGVVVLKERRVNVGHVTHNKHASQEKAAGGANAASVTEQAGKSAVSAGMLTMQRVTTQRNKKRQSHPLMKMDSQMSMQRNKKRQSYPQVAKMDDSHPTDENDAHILAQPAEGLPDGWVFRRIPRPSGSRKDPYWYSPKKKFKFRSKPEAQRFLASLGETNGDESAAMLLFKKKNGRGRRSSTGNASQNIDNISLLKEQGETNELAVEEMGEAKMPSVENASSKMKSTENVASSEGPVHKSVEDSTHASKTKFVSDITEAAMPNRAGDTTTSPMKKGVPPREEVGASPPPGKLSVRVQLYENELQTDHREGVETSNRKMSAQQGEANDLREELKAATDSNSLQGTNNEMANLLHEKEAALREAETIISTLRQEALSATNNIQRLSISNDVAELRHSKEVENNRVTSLESSLRMEQLTVQDLQRQLGNAENDIVKLTQQNKRINELNASLQCSLLGSQLAMKEAQMAEARMVADVARVTEEKARVNEAQLVRMADARAEARNDATTSDIHKKFVTLVEAEARLLMQMEIQGGTLSRNMGVNDGVLGQQQGRHAFGMPRDAGVSGMPRTPQDAAGGPGGPSDFFSQPAFMGQGNFPSGGAGTGAGAAGLSSSLQRQFMEQFGASMPGGMPRGVPGGGMPPPSPTAGATAQGQQFGFPNQIMMDMPMGTRAKMMADMMRWNGKSKNNANQPNPGMM